MTAKEEAEKILRHLAETKKALAASEKAYQAELEALKARYGDIAVYQGILKGLDEQLQKLMKKNKTELFDGKDLVRLTCGRLIHELQTRIKGLQGKGIIDRIKQMGWLEGVKVVESVDKPVVEKWTDERLIAVGCERKKDQDVFSYEITE